MTTASVPATSSHDERSTERIGWSVLWVAAAMIVAASHLGMIWLASVYVEQGRLESVLTPEAVVGVLAIAITFAAVMGVPAGGVHISRLRAAVWLLAFVALAVVSELLQAERRLGNLSTFISLFGYFAVGVAIGRRLVAPARRLPFAGTLLFIYALWYLSFLIFYIRGDLGFFNVLPGVDVARLEFSSGFRATEIPIYVGFHFPVLLHIAFTRCYGALLRGAAVILAFSALLLVYFSASVAAIVALLLVGVVFLYAWRGLSLSRLVGGSALVGGIVVAAVITGSALAESAQTKLGQLVAGEGVRATIYADLLGRMIENPLLGMGKGRFVETNAFSWLGESVYPHQNLLGIGAELGVPALCAFVAFLLTSIVALGRRVWSVNSGLPLELRQLVAIGLAVFLYQQFRGLFQDTWTFKETYFWLGLSFGIVARELLTRNVAPRAD